MNCEFCGKRACNDNCLNELLNEQNIKSICEGCGVENETKLSYCNSCLTEEVKIFKGSY